MILLNNKKAYYDYEILETFEAGMLLQGWEVKSLRAKNGNIKAAWITLQDPKHIYIDNLQISPYPFAQQEMIKGRNRALLLHKKEATKIRTKALERGITIIPTKIYTKGKHIKCEVAIARGKQKHEKRQVLKERAMKKEAQKVLKNF